MTLTRFQLDGYNSLKQPQTVDNLLNGGETYSLDKPPCGLDIITDWQKIQSLIRDGDFVSHSPYGSVIGGADNSKDGKEPIPSRYLCSPEFTSYYFFSFTEKGIDQRDQRAARENTVFVFPNVRGYEIVEGKDCLILDDHRPFFAICVPKNVPTTSFFLLLKNELRELTKIKCTRFIGLVSEYSLLCRSNKDADIWNAFLSMFLESISKALGHLEAGE